MSLKLELRKCITVEMTSITLVNMAGTHMQTAVITAHEVVPALLCATFCVVAQPMDVCHLSDKENRTAWSS